MSPVTRTSSRRERNGARNGSKPLRLAAVHARADRLFVVLATADHAGGVHINEMHAFARAEADQAARLLARHKVDRVIGVVPSAQSIVRLAEAPVLEGAIDASALAGALDLTAEAELGPVAPHHRRTAGIVSPGGPGSKPVALAQSWAAPAAPAAAPLPPGPPDALAHAHVEPDAWITAPAALAVLAQALGGAELAIDADPQAGAAAIIASRGGQTIARVARLDNGSPETWRAELAEAAGGAGGCGTGQSGAGPWPVKDGEVASGAMLWLVTSDIPHRPEAGATGISGIPHQPEAVATWIRDYGLCAGALAAAASADPAVQSLANLHRRPPEQEQPGLVRLASWLSEPKRAAVLAAACVLAALLAPVGAAYGRWWMLSREAGGRAALSERLEDARNGVEFHGLLREERWPMTKLLADVASSAPEGVQLDVLDLSRGGGLSVRGTAESTGLITQFRENLAKTRVFGAIEVPTRAESAANVEFQLNARVDNPLASQVVVDDFGKRTLFQRIYGDDAVPSDAPPVAAAGDDDSPRSARSGSRSTRRAEQGDGGEPSRGASRRDAVAPVQIPPPLTDEQLAAMDSSAATAAMNQRSEALKSPDLDEATRQRLRDEQQRAKVRMLQALKEQRR